MSPTDFNEIERAARDLLAALERMHNRSYLSENVMNARDHLRFLLPLRRDPKDEGREAA